MSKRSCLLSRSGSSLTFCALLAVVTWVPSNSVAGQRLPIYFLKQGKIENSRGLTVGDPKNWITLTKQLIGQSKGGKLRTQPTKFRTDYDSVRATWSGCCEMGMLAIYGNAIDFSGFVNTGSLTFDYLVHSPPTLGVDVGMDCQFPCAAGDDVSSILKKTSTGTWDTLSIPLRCIDSDNFDLAKITGVFTMKTSGELDMSIANIRIEAVQGDKVVCP